MSHEKSYAFGYGMLAEGFNNQKKNHIMNVEELRIGNIIFISWKNAVNKRVAVVNLGAIMDLASNGSGSAYNYKPIPLSEKWLIKFGFEKQVTRYMVSYKKGLIDISYFNKSKVISIYVGAQRIDNGERIKHVHQLQNLYFALTGEELEVR